MLNMYRDIAFQVFFWLLEHGPYVRPFLLPMAVLFRISEGKVFPATFFAILIFIRIQEVLFLEVALTENWLIFITRTGDCKFLRSALLQ